MTGATSSAAWAVGSARCPGRGRGPGSAAARLPRVAMAFQGTSSAQGAAPRTPLPAPREPGPRPPRRHESGSVTAADLGPQTLTGGGDGVPASRRPSRAPRLLCDCVTTLGDRAGGSAHHGRGQAASGGCCRPLEPATVRPALPRSPAARASWGGGGGAFLESWLAIADEHPHSPPRCSPGRTGRQ